MGKGLEVEECSGLSYEVISCTKEGEEGFGRDSWAWIVKHLQLTG